MRNESGQVLLLLIVIITIALATGLSIIQKSISDVSTASKVEQSSRAFSAAEAGIEQTLQGGSGNVIFSENNSSAIVSDQGLQPVVVAGSPQNALEYPPLAKEDIVQVWLANFNDTSNPPAIFYNPPSSQLDVYWGSKQTNDNDDAALEITLVYHDGINYLSKKWYFDSYATRAPENNFEKVNCSGGNTPEGGNIQYYCKKTIEGLPAAPSRLILLRARLLYNSVSQPLAVQAVGTCGFACSLPPQAREIYSRGISGETQRTIKIFQVEKVVPFYYDYAIFSTGEISK